MKAKEEYYRYGEALGIRINDLQRLMVLAKAAQREAAQQPNPGLIDSMALRFRHDFGLLLEEQKAPIRRQMHQLWEEVVGLGFYQEKDQ